MRERLSYKMQLLIKRDGNPTDIALPPLTGVATGTFLLRIDGLEGEQLEPTATS
jgi:hypothetical protein